MGGRFAPIAQAFGYIMVSIAVIVAVMTARLMADGKDGLQEATFALETGNRTLAAAALEDAAMAYMPGSPFPRQALRELVILARSAEMRGELTDAIAQWEKVRRAIIATRHVYQPNSDLLQVAEQNLVRIRSDAGNLDLSIDLTHHPEDPSVFLSILIFLGLIVWITGATTVALSPRDRDGRPFVKGIFAWMIAGLGLALWIVAAALV